jgi:ribose-phosphate pyrophosphokinase
MEEPKLIENDNLRLIVYSSAKELGEKVNKHLLKMYGYDKDKDTFIVPIKENFFDDGHLKVEIKDTVRSKDVFMLTDIGNYSLEYTMHGFTNHTSPNDIMIQLKDGIGACNRHAENINIIMPLLYAGRQHRRNTRENLTCGQALRELDDISKIRSFITFDAHDQGVEHAIRNMEFDNFYAVDMILDKFIDDLSLDELKNLVFIAPDNGAVGRRNVYLNSFSYPDIHREAGSFVKQRDFNNLVDGKYPILSHDYSGNKNLKGKTAIIVDDMISSGGSMFDVVKELKNLHIGNVYIIVTYALFTKGIDEFRKLYKEGKIQGIYTSNLSYIPLEYLKEEWLHVCDCSKELSQIIYNIHNDLSISSILRDRSESVLKLEKTFKEDKKK